MFAGPLQAKRVTLELEVNDDVPDLVLSDEGKLRRVLSTVVSSALTFAPSCSRIFVHVTVVSVPRMLGSSDGSAASANNGSPDGGLDSGSSAASTSAAAAKLLTTMRDFARDTVRAAPAAFAASMAVQRFASIRVLPLHSSAATVTGDGCDAAAHTATVEAVKALPAADAADSAAAADSTMKLNEHDELPQLDSFMRIAVRDHGPGERNAELARVGLFAPRHLAATVRSSAAHERDFGQQRGAALGLSVCKSLLSVCGGSLVIEDSPARPPGSTRPNAPQLRGCTTRFDVPISGPRTHVPDDNGCDSAEAQPPSFPAVDASAAAADDGAAAAPDAGGDCASAAPLPAARATSAASMPNLTLARPHALYASCSAPSSSCGALQLGTGPLHVFPETRFGRSVKSAGGGAGAELPPPLMPCTAAVVVDGDSASCEFLCRMLRRRGVSTLRVACDGPAALDLLGTLSAVECAAVQVWLLGDWDVPRCDVRECSSRLRQLGVAAPIFAVSGYASDEDRRSFIASGATTVIVKPVRDGSLEAAFAAAGLALLQAPL